MTTVFFVRHAEPMHSWEDDRSRPLTNEGKNDALKLIDFFKDMKIDSFISSPYKRSYETINPIAEYFTKTIELDERLRERKSGKNGNNLECLHKRWEDKKFAEEDGECINSVQLRNIKALHDILMNKVGQVIVIGTHGTALGSIINYYKPNYCCADFLTIINYMPYIVKMLFNGKELIELEETMIVKKV